MSTDFGSSRGLWLALVTSVVALAFMVAPRAEAKADAVLSVTTAGNGQGYVTSTPNGIDCGQNLGGHGFCSASFADGQDVTLVAHTFVGFQWSGACAGAQPGQLVCTVTMDQAQSATATFSKLSPGASVVTNDSFLGSSIWATGALQGGLVPAQGTFTFRLYGVGDTNCTGAPVYTDTHVVTTQGSFGSGPYTPTQAGDYRWTATYSGDDDNNGSATACNAPGTVANVAKASPSVGNGATNADIGDSITNTASLGGGAGPTGTITFKLYSPGDTSCSSAPQFTSTVAVNGTGQYSAGNFTPTQAGAYRWRIDYSGDSENNAVTTSCGASGSISTVSKASPQISIDATDATVGSPIGASGPISGGVSPTGTITFRAYGPDDSLCQGNPAFTSAPVPVNGNGTYSSGNVATTRAGEYRWTASYSGDVNNSTVVSNCGAPDSTSTVSKAAPTLTHAEVGNATVGTNVAYDSSLGGGYDLTGAITFRAYGPADAECSGTPAFTAQATDVAGPGLYGTDAFTPTHAGEYHWVAVYAGDENNEAATASCSATASTVAKASPSISIGAEDARIGEAISATATVADGYSPGGTITFLAYGPGNTCTGAPAFTATVSVDGNGDYESGPFTPDDPGSYMWLAEYSGDADNAPTASDCGDAVSTVDKARPDLALTASGDIRLGEKVSASATLTAGHQPSGDVAFRLYGPDDQTCSGRPAFEANSPLAADGTSSSPEFEPQAIGEYRWVAEYAGDAGNDPAAVDCAGAKVVQVAPLTCPAVTVRAIASKPRVIVKGRMTKGVRARISVSSPSVLAIKGRLRYTVDGRSREVDLGSRSLRDNGSRALRLPLPKNLRKRLPYGKQVKLTLIITATPNEPKGCTSPPRTVSHIKVRVVHVLTRPQAP
ncbi:MAG: hypothetical protein J0H98_09640 [Solirubrobacterales bacterium]|nr:hypothetical protein [Solirubrobacterales bacterium]